MTATASMQKLLLPEDIRARCARQFAREHVGWLGRAAIGLNWPQAMLLGSPKESEAASEPESIRAWAHAWRAWNAARQPGQVLWETRRWLRMGDQQLPVSLVLGSAEELADLAGQGARWRRACARYALLCDTCAALVGRSASQRLFDALADYSDADSDRLISLIRWFDQHPSSGLQLRQLPVVGLDTKWVEQRRGLIVDLALARLPREQAEGSVRDMHALLGLAKPATRIRLRLLGDGLRRQVGGLSDIEAPLDELAALPIAPRLVLVAENLESGLALPAIPGAVALMKLGHAVNLLRQLPWMPAARVVVWGDVDTHGFAILDRVRSAFPQTDSMLMDSDTLLGHRHLWVEEPQPYVGPHLERLTAQERQVFDGLKAGTWGARVRLEQERLPWPVVVNALGRFSS